MTTAPTGALPERIVGEAERTGPPSRSAVGSCSHSPDFGAGSVRLSASCEARDRSELPRMLCRQSVGVPPLGTQLCEQVFVDQR